MAVEVCFDLEQGDETCIRREMDEYLARRRETQPVDYPSAGSVFKNPPGYYAGREEAGAVPRRRPGFPPGTPTSSSKTGGATADDVSGLIETVRATGVERACGNPAGRGLGRVKL